MARVWICLLLAGCDFGAPGAGGDGGVDPGGDGSTPGMDAARLDASPITCNGAGYGADPFPVCLSATPTGAVTIDASVTINTDDCTTTIPGLTTGQKIAQMQNGAPMICVFAAGSILANGTITIRAQGSLPLGLLAHTSLTIRSNVTIDVSGASMGAAGNVAGCAGANGGNNGNGGGGGAGGSFGTSGGNGAAVMGAGAGSTAAPAVTPTFLRGGCAGGRGGNAGTSSGGDGGNGGGAVYLLAGVQLEIDGRINASGSGGLATTGGGRGGGGGGGSGGMIALWAGNQITVAPGAQIWANGGGGAAGSDGSDIGDGGGASTSPGARAPGGSANASGCTNGGDGANNGLAGADGGPGGDKSGGGGGGGVGWIENVGPGGAISPGQFSPAAR